MKINFFVLLLCSWFLSIGNAYAGESFDFRFKIWKNSVSPANYLGEYTGHADDAGNYAISTPMPHQLCPGDQLIIRNYTSREGLAHSFDGGSDPLSRKATIGLSCATGHGHPVSILADICPGGGCHDLYPNPDPVSFSSWNWGADISITIPPYACSSTNLLIGTTIMGSPTPPFGCGPRWFYIPINLAPTTSIPSQSICPGDVVNLSLDPDFTYNWSPSNPDGTSPTSTQTYTVDVTHTATGCTQTKNVLITVNNPDIDPFADNETLCFDDAGFTLTEDWFWGLSGSSTYPMKLVVNGVLIADEDPSPDIMNFPLTINGDNYGAGTVTVEYTYHNFQEGITCTKTYNITIHPEIIIDMNNIYGFCDGNFEPICVLPPLTAQIGVSYQWTKVGELIVYGTGPCFTPTSYGNYCVTATDAFGCKKTHCFEVVESGIGIPYPKSISFCSLTDAPPTYIGWPTDPFGPVPYSFSWTYTDESGTTVSVSPPTVLYQVPYMGPGVYTATATSMGCSETFEIHVIDQLEVFTNHSYANFSTAPLFAGQATCQPFISLAGGVDFWTVVDQFGNSIPTTPHLGGIRFPYTPGVLYQITLRREVARDCKVYINRFSWMDDPSRNRNRNNSSSKISNTSNNTGLNSSINVTAYPNPTTGQITIQLQNATQPSSFIQVSNTLGQVVLQKEVKEASTIQLDLSKETTGIYMVRVLNGDQEQTIKITKD